MSTYAIGDVQGCLDSLKALLDTIHFDPKQDTLWFTGDLANRGTQPLQTLRFIKNLPESTVCVLGNHDLALLAAIEGVITFPEDETARSILTAPDKEELYHWLRHLPLLHHDPTLGIIMAHAGIYPFWDLEQAKRYAKEVEHALQGEHYHDLLKTMYGNMPSIWDNSLTGADRMRFIINAYSRMRFITNEGKLELKAKGTPNDYPSLTPWFKVKNRIHFDESLIFGHWAALNGECEISGMYALDEGCVWGGCLTALCLETKQRFKVKC